MSNKLPGTLQQNVSETVRTALAEDVGSGDISAALISASRTGHASVLTRDEGTFCGMPWVRETCAQVDGAIAIEPAVEDGARVHPNQVLFTLSGPAGSLLTAERTMLNFVQLLSGTATLTRKFVDLINHTSARLLDTRKTVPGLRAAQKYAVRCGGGFNHRMGLFDAFLIKENHIVAAGSIKAAVDQARQDPQGRPVEVEVETLGQLTEVIDAKAQIALIDNFSLADTRRAVAMAQGHIKLEASGGIDEATITDIAETGVDYISIGLITKNVEPLDLSMRMLD